MDVISALSVAGDILTVTKLSVELLSTSDASKTSSLEENEEALALRNFKNLRVALSSNCASLQQQLPVNTSPLLNDELALLDMATSCLERSGEALEGIRNIPSDIPGNRHRPWKLDMNARHRLEESFSPDNIKQVYRAVTRHVSSILR